MKPAWFAARLWPFRHERPAGLPRSRRGACGRRDFSYGGVARGQATRREWDARGGEWCAAPWRHVVLAGAVAYTGSIRRRQRAKVECSAPVPIHARPSSAPILHPLLRMPRVGPGTHPRWIEGTRSASTSVTRACTSRWQNAGEDFGTLAGVCRPSEPVFLPAVTARGRHRGAGRAWRGYSLAFPEGSPVGPTVRAFLQWFHAFPYGHQAGWLTG